MATNHSRRPARQGLSQLLTVEALRTLARSPRVFWANVRQGPEFLRDRGRRLDLADVAAYLESEEEAVCAVLGVAGERYAEAVAKTWMPQADPDEPRSAWNAREELLRMVSAVVRLTRPATVVETGVALGFTTATVLRAMADIGAGRLHSIDLPALQHDPRERVGGAVPPELEDRWELILGDSRRELEPLCARVAPLDVFLHDALHTYSSQLREYRTVWPYLCSGGVLISDDVDNPAFIEFALEVGARPHLVVGPSRESATGLLRKP